MIRVVLPSDRLETVRTHLTRVRENEHKQTKWRHKAKIERWMEKNGGSNGNEEKTNDDKWVRNLSNKQLSDADKSLLSKGLNFAITPDKLPVKDFVVATEQATWNLSRDEADSLRSEVTGIIKRAKLPRSNLTKEEKQSMKILSKDKDILILPEDKRRATVVLDKEDYEKKVMDMLSDDRTYEKLNGDPTSKFKRKLVSILQRLKAEDKLSKEQYDKLYPTSENVPRMYCTPKIHKPNTPLRPIVDYTGSIGYSTSRLLADILGPLVGQTAQHVKNSKDFSQALSGVLIQDDEIFNSHDVVSLFTNTPIDRSLEIIQRRLESDRTLKKRPKLNTEDVMELLGFILTTTYFQFREQIFQQKFGTAMGSPVSPLVANLFMEWLEQEAIATSPITCEPKLWKRYVDDILEIIKKGQVEQLTEHLNKVDSTESIKFTSEEEHEGQIPFLDTLIVRKDDGTVKLLVYRKPTHTDQYLQFDSHHPLSHKLSVVRTLVDRCFSIVTEREDQEKEIKHISKALKGCGYPQWTITRTVEQVETRRREKKGRNKRQEEKKKSKGMVVIPYIQNVSEALARVFRKHNISVAMRPHNTLRRVLVHPKDKTKMEDVSGCVYSIPCKSCDSVYIGETGRKLGKRIGEHKKDSENSPAVFTRSERIASQTREHTSAVTNHIARQNHVIDWEGVKIVDREDNAPLRRLRESICIAAETRIMNRDEGGYQISPIYRPLFTTGHKSGSRHAL